MFLASPRTEQKAARPGALWRSYAAQAGGYDEESSTRRAKCVKRAIHWRELEKHRETPIGVSLRNDGQQWFKRRRAETGAGFSAFISAIVREHRERVERSAAEAHDASANATTRSANEAAATARTTTETV